MLLDDALEVLGGEPVLDLSRNICFKHAHRDFECHGMSRIRSPGGVHSIDPDRRDTIGQQTFAGLTNIAHEFDPSRPSQAVWVEFGTDGNKSAGSTTVFPIWPRHKSAHRPQP